MRARIGTALAAVAVLAAGCTSSGGGPGTTGDGDAGSSEPTAASVRTAVPGEPLTVVADAEPVALALSASRALFAGAEVAVLARDGDRAGLLLAASAAAGLGVPLLLEPSGTGADDGVREELDRLGATVVLAVGEAGSGEGGNGEGGDDGPERVAVPADAGAVAEATGLEWAEEAAPAREDTAAAVAALDGDEPVALTAGGGSGDAGESGDAGDDVLPAVERGEPLADVAVLATADPANLAGIATARAAGARVHLTGDATDPRGLPEVVTALGEDEPEAVVVLGAGFADEEGLDWKVATAATGVQLPAGGQLLFPGSFLVALYGHPGTGALGVLGEQPLPEAIERARRHAAPYEPLVDTTVVPAFEIIATVASEFAGPDGNYSTEVPAEELRPWVEAAGEAGLYVVLDLQPGRTDYVTQAELYRDLLEQPHVGLALDPEWRLEPNQVHLQQIGSVDVEEVNRVVTWLADLTRENSLPQKLLVLHQFRLDMLPGRDRLDLSRDELAVMVHADGQGPQGSKQATWRALREGAQPELTWGWKNFYDEDSPMLTPEQTIDQVDPRPELITYQ